MPERPLAIAVDGVSKDFRLAAEQRHTLKERIVNPRFDRTAHLFHALEDVSFEVARGEFFGIVGRNGSGKSTLLKCMAGIYKVDHGSIRIGGRLSTFIELGVGFNPDLAARDNIILNGIMLGLTPKEAAKRVDPVIRFAELEDHVDLKLKNYSSGMQVRLAFSVLTKVDADVLLIDEVLAVGDAAFQAKCFDVFRQLRDAGKTIILVTHDMGAVSRFCDRAMLLEDGKIVTIGDPDVVGDGYLALNFEERERSPEEITAGESSAEVPDDGPEPLPAVSALRATAYDRDFQLVHNVRSGDDVMLAIDLRANEEGHLPVVTVELHDEFSNVVVSASTPVDVPDRPTIGAGQLWRAQLWLRAFLGTGRLRVRTVLTDAATGRMIERSGDLGHVEITSVEQVLGVANVPHDLQVGPIHEIEGFARPELHVVGQRGTGSRAATT